MFILAALRALSSIPALEVLRLDPGAVGRVDVVAVRVAAVRGVALAKLGDEHAVHADGGGSEMEDHEFVQLALPVHPEALEVDVLERPVPFLPRIPQHLRHAGVDVGVPLEVPSESVQAGDHARHAGGGIVCEEVDAPVAVVDAFPRLPRLLEELLVFLGVGEDADRVAGRDVHEVEQGPVDPEQHPVLLGDREDDVPVVAVHADCGRRCRKEPLRLCAAGGAEPAVACVVDERGPVADGAFEAMPAELVEVAEDGLRSLVEGGLPDLALDAQLVQRLEVVEQYPRDAALIVVSLV